MSVLSPAMQAELAKLHRLFHQIEQHHADALEDLNASIEYFQHLAKNEQDAVSRCKLAGVKPKHFYSMSNQVFRRLTYVTRADCTRFFEASRAFTMLSMSLPQDAAPHHVAAKAGAAWFMSHKFSSVVSYDQPRFSPETQLRLVAVECNKVLTQHFEQAGVSEITPVTTEDILAEERKAMADCPECVSLPNIFTWLEAMVSRLDVATKKQFQAKLKQAMQLALQLAAEFMGYGFMAYAQDANDAPRTWAIGILGYALRTVGVLHDSTFQGSGRSLYRRESCPDCIDNEKNDSAAPHQAEQRMALQFAVIEHFEKINKAVHGVMLVLEHYRPAAEARNAESCKK